MFIHLLEFIQLDGKLFHPAYKKHISLNTFENNGKVLYREERSDVLSMIPLCTVLFLICLMTKVHYLVEDAIV